MTTIGILGAGKLGTVLARLSVAAGYRTLIASSADPEQIALLVEVMAPGAVPVPAADVTREADIVILAVPLSRFRSIPHDGLTGKLIIDAMNYWPAVDGHIPELEPGGHPSSTIVAAELSESRVVRAFSHLGYHQLDEDARPHDASDRHAIAVAGDDPDAVVEVCELVDRLGFDPVVAGDLASSMWFGPGTRLFGTSTSRHEVVRLIHQQSAEDHPSRPSAAKAVYT